MVTLAGMVGYAPSVSVNPPNPEIARYERMWAIPQYRETSPGAFMVDVFLKLEQPTAGATVIDFGCGMGHDGLELVKAGGMNVTMIDFASNCLDSEVAEYCTAHPDQLRFKLVDLTNSFSLTADYGFCSDVMEHIQPEHVKAVLKRIISASRRTFFSISCVPEVHGPAFGVGDLHLTVKPPQWWKEQLQAWGVHILWSSVHDYSERYPDEVVFHCYVSRSPEDAGVTLSLPDGYGESVGEALLNVFLQRVAPARGATCTDFGCGTGVGALTLAAVGGLKMLLLDRSDVLLDPDVYNACSTQPDFVKFMFADFTQPLSTATEYGYCVNVLNRIAEENIPITLQNILAAANKVFLSVSTKKFDKAWWEEKLRATKATIHWIEDEAYADQCCFYVSSWTKAKDMLPAGEINTDAETRDRQIRENIAAGWKHVSPFMDQDREVIILCGGPSLNDGIDEIKELRAEGAALVTMNGTYQWALDRDLKPSMQIVCDAREFNARFTKPVTDYTKYLIAAQVHPKTLEGLPKDRTLLWHMGVTEDQEKLIRDAAGYYFPIPGGTTVTLRAIPLLRLLGYKKFHLFGFDSCSRADQHHAYSQPENDGESYIQVSCGDKLFYCAAWELQQAEDFSAVVEMLGDQIDLAVYGDGLIAAMVREGARLSVEE